MAAFNNELFLKLQRENISKRIEQFNNKLYLEFGGKIFDDYHASRVLPGFQVDSKIQMLLGLRDKVEVIIAISAGDIEKSKIRGDNGISYEDEVFRMIDSFKELDLYVGSVVVTKYNKEPEVKRNEKPHQYYVDLTDKLRALKQELINLHTEETEKPIQYVK